MLFFFYYAEEKNKQQNMKIIPQTNKKTHKQKNLTFCEVLILSAETPGISAGRTGCWGCTTGSDSSLPDSCLVLGVK